MIGLSILLAWAIVAVILLVAGFFYTSFNKNLTGKLAIAVILASIGWPLLIVWGYTKILKEYSKEQENV